MSFRNYRILLLLLILLLVAWDAWLDHAEITAWDHPLQIVVYPINADGQATTEGFVAQLRTSHFDGIEQLVRKQAAHYGVALDQPMEITLATTLKELPPQPPMGGNILDIMWWNFKVRRWANQVDNGQAALAEIRVFAQYYDHHANEVLNHSVGVEKGRIAIVNLFATRAMAGENDMVLLHEVLHTLGATDKYDLASNQPLYPQGYAQPDLQPRHPQRYAEVMAGRIPLSETTFTSPMSLSKVIIGATTAREIGWIE